jgi:hypothetical protein
LELLAEGGKKGKVGGREREMKETFVKENDGSII